MNVKQAKSQKQAKVIPFEFQDLADQRIPYSQEAEEAVLGAVITDPAAFINVAAFLKARDFFLLRHVYIWEAMLEIDRRGADVDYLTITDELKSTGRLDEVGGAAYVTQLIDRTPTSMHAETYGKLVQAAATKRKIMEAADEIKALALQHKPVAEIKDEAEALLFEATASDGAGEPQTAQLMLSEYWDTLSARADDPDMLINVPTGFQEFDTKFGGIEPGEMMIVGGVQGMGKSSLVLSMAMNQARLGLRVAIFSNEMTLAKYAQRMTAIETGLNIGALRTTTDKITFSKLAEAIDRMGEWALHIDYTPGLKPIQVQRKTRRLVQEGGLDIIYIDGLWRMQPDQHIREYHEKFVDISLRLSEMAKDFNIPIVAVQQVDATSVNNRKERRPYESDLRGSQAFAQDAAIVSMVYREAKYNPATEHPGEAEWIIRKGRDIGEPTIKLHFDNRTLRFSDLRPPGGIPR